MVPIPVQSRRSRGARRVRPGRCCAVFDDMKATSLLESQHRAVEARLREIAMAEDPRDQRFLFDELARSLVAHDIVERELFYRAAEVAVGMMDLIGESNVLHGPIEMRP